MLVNGTSLGFGTKFTWGLAAKTLIYLNAPIALSGSCPSFLLGRCFGSGAPRLSLHSRGKFVDLSASSRAGYALMGGGTDLDEAFKWLCERAAGGDFLVLRASGDEDYNPYVQKLCPLNSVATLILPNRAAALDPFVARTIREAAGIFIAGGDQANYINFWQGTPVDAALNEAIAKGVPIGGTSAGLAVLGEYAYSAQGDKPKDQNLDAKTAFADPLGPRITLTKGLVNIPILKGIITDTHFAKRNRMGRLLVFLARLKEESAAVSGAKQIRGIGVEQGAAVLLEPSGEAKVVGKGSAYFVDAGKATGVVAKGQAFAYGPFSVEKVEPGHSFNVKSWSGDATTYSLSVKDGAIQSTQAGGAVY